jgi:UDP-3-O-[3-hydroxymyristoyl] glucosamine N-acyltransferase
MVTTVAAILDKIPALECIGNRDRVIERIVGAQAEEILGSDLVWISEKNTSMVYRLRNGSIICSNKIDRSTLNATACTYIIVENPRLYFLQVAKFFFMDRVIAFISPKSEIDPSVKIGKEVTIRAGVVIEANCVIGDLTQIDSNTVIKKGTKIGDRVKIGANNTIGGDGFGYEMNTDRQFEFIPHLGNVVIEDDVEIGNNTTIDRAVLGSTLLRKNCKIDNLVHIAHGVEIGENSLIIANAMIAGSCVIGQNVWVAPSASILNKLSVANNVTIGMGAVVLKNVSEGSVIVGNPGKDIRRTPNP